MLKKYISDLKLEFSGYNGTRLTKDIMAGITVAAVSLPLALAFSVSSGADAAAGLITAIVSGLVIGALSGGSFQISGPTGTMTAVMLMVAARYGMQGIFVATLLAGVIRLICGICRLGKLVNLIPMPVVTGFTSGIAIIIALGQIDSFFGTHSVGENTLQKLASYATVGFHIDYRPMVIGLIVIAVMLLYPKKWNNKLSSSLVSIIIAGIACRLLAFDIGMVGEIPRTLLPDNRLNFSAINLEMITNLIAPAFSIAALAMIETLLCGTSAARMKNEEFDADRELVAQGIGNIIIPIFGGIPSTAALARTSVAIRAGSQTRLTGIFHSVVLLLCMFLFGPVIAQLPLAALSGVLIVTAWRMNDWQNIKYYFSHKLYGAIAKYLITMIATVVFDLTIAIIIGIMFSMFLFVKHSANIQISVSDVDTDKLTGIDEKLKQKLDQTSVVYITGPLFFATADKLTQCFKSIQNQAYIDEKGDLCACDRVLFSMRGVPTIDTTGAAALLEVCQKLHDNNINVALCGVQDTAKPMLAQIGLEQELGAQNFYWSVDKALLSI